MNTVSGDDIYANIIEKYLPELNEAYSRSDEEYKALLNRYESQLTDDEIITHDESGQLNAVLVTKKLMNIKYKISIPLVHQSNTYQLDLSETKSTLIGKADITLRSVKVSPYRMTILAYSSMWRPIREIAKSGGLDMIIEMENGEQVLCDMYGSGSDPTTGEFIIAADFNERRNGGGKVCTIDTTNIRAIYMGETKICG